MNRLLGLPCDRLDLDCLQTSMRQWYADPYHFWLRMRVVVDHPERSVPPLFGMRFGEGAESVRRHDRDSDTSAIEFLLARVRTIWTRSSIA